jgi:hypothetical protein
MDSSMWFGSVLSTARVMVSSSTGGVSGRTLDSGSVCTNTSRTTASTTSGASA